MSRLDRALVRVGGVKAEIRIANPNNVAAPTGALATQSYYGGKSNPQYEQFPAVSGIDGAYLANLYVYRCVDTIAKALSGCPYRAGLNPDKIGSFNVKSPLAQLLGPAPGSPNPQWSARQLWRYAAAQYVITGKMAWAKGYDDNGIIDSLWPLSVQFLQPIPGPDTGFQYFSGFRYGNPGSPMYREYKAEDIVYVWRPSLKDFRQPESVIQAAQMNISVLRMIDTYDYTFLKNNAVPSTLVITDPFAEPEQRRAFRDQFVTEFTGYGNAGKTLFLESGDDDDPNAGPKTSDSISVSRLGLTQKESQQNESRDAKIRDTCVAMGVPLSILMDSSLAKFQNADQDARNFWHETMLPLMTEITDGVNIQLAPDLGHELGWFDTRSVQVLQPPRTFKPEDSYVLVTSRIITRDEYRDDLGLPPYAEVDPANLPVVYSGTPSTQSGVAVEAAGSVVNGNETDTGIGAKPPAPVLSVVPPLPGAKPALPAARAAGGDRETRTALDVRHPGHDHSPIPSGHVHANSTPAHVIKALESMMTKGMQSLMAEQAKSTGDRLAGRRGRKQTAHTVADIFDTSYWEGRTAAVIEPIMAGIEIMETRAQFGDTPKKLGVDITAESIGHLQQALDLPTPDQVSAAVGDVFSSGPARAIELLKGKLVMTSRTIARSTVEQRLLAIHQGRMTVEEAVASLGESA